MYFDESGTNYDAPYIYVAGCMMEKDAWLSLEEGWGAILRQFDIERFRASDCEAAQGPFKGWSRDKRNEIFRRFAKEMCKQDFVISRVGINKQLFESTSAHFPNVTVSLYEFCVMWSINILGILPIIIGKKGTIELFFESGQDVRFHVRNWIEGMKNRKDYALTTVEFYSKKDLIPYQVADLIVWEYLKYTKNLLKDESSPVRPSLETIISNPKRFITKDFDYDTKKDLKVQLQILNSLSPSGFKPPQSRKGG